MTPLVFKHYDHAVIFKVLNNLPQKVQVRFIDNTQTAIFEGNRLYKYKVNSQTQGKEWLTSLRKL